MMQTIPMSALARILRWVVMLLGFGTGIGVTGQVRDGGIDPWNLGKGDWIYYLSMATNKLGGNVPAVTNEASLMLHYRAHGIRYLIIKAATSDQLFNGSYQFPQFNSNIVNIAHAHNLLVFGYNRSYGSNIVGEIAIADYVFQQGADGFVFDAEAEWEKDKPWIGDEGPAKAWQLCSAVRSNWPNKFLAHAPFPIISYHTSFPYKEFGYWCDAVMPQIYPAGWTGVKSRPSGGIDWTDVNWHNWHESLRGTSSVINGQTIYWTNAIKPLAPVNHVYGPNPPNQGVSEIPPEFVMEFVDYLVADPHAQTAGGYRGASFWRADLHGAQQWANIKAVTIGDFPGTVNNLVLDDARASVSGTWNSTRTFYNGRFYGEGSGTDTNSFGTNYLTKARGSGDAFVQFTPTILQAGDYDVYEWHPTLAAASAQAPFLITHSGGTTLVLANQRTNAGRWSLLGRFNFAAGASGNIRVLDSVAEPGAVAIADGIKLVFAAPTSAPAPPTELTATPVSPTEIALSWRDNATNETGLVVARSEAAGGPYVEVAALPANRTQYTDTGLAPARTYWYVVRAVNAAGASPDAGPVQATTPALVPPTILAQPRGLALMPGLSAQFSVLASGSPPLRYQWLFEGAAIPGATNSVLTLPSVQSSNAGIYAVTVSNAAGAITSANAQLSLAAVGAWGDNQFEQAWVSAEATNLIAVAAGGWHNLGLHPDGRVVGWGCNGDGQCQPPPDLRDAVAIAAGGYHSLAIRAGGQVVAWGANDSGQCAVPPGLRDVVAVAAGDWHSLALRADGTVVAWGDNSCGQSSVPPGLSGVTAIAAGGRHCLALRTNGTVAAWGDNLDETGSFAGQSLAPWGLTDVVGIAAGDAHSLAVRADGTVVAWGANSHGQGVAPAALTTAVAVAAGGQHSLALTEAGGVVAWGAAWNGQCALPAGLTNVIAVAGGKQHTVVLVADAVPVPRLLRPSWQDGRFSAVIQTLLRHHYSLEFKDHLSDPDWMSLSAAPGNGALRLLSDPAAAVPARFYRLRTW